MFKTHRFGWLLLLAGMASAQARWIPRGPMPSAEAITHLVCSPMRCVATTSSDVLEATDRFQWNLVSGIVPDEIWLSLAFHEGRFLLVGRFTVGTSTDGLRWDFQSFDPQVQNWGFHGGAWTGRRWTVFGQADTNLVSDDGRTWRPDTSGLHTFSDHGVVVQHGTLVVASFPSDVTWFSTDSGTTWKASVDSSMGALGAMTSTEWNGREFLSAFQGVLVSSTDGNNWERLLTPVDVSTRAVASDSTQDVMVGAGRNPLEIWRRPKGGSWARIDSSDFDLNTVLLQPAPWGGFVGVGDVGLLVFSDDGSHWGVAGGTATLRDVVWSGDRFVAVGDKGRIVVLPDGVLGTEEGHPVQPSFRAVAAHNGWRLAAGLGGALWVAKDTDLSDPVDLATTADLLAAVYDGTLFTVAGDSGLAFESSDLRSWKRDPLPLQAKAVKAVRAGGKAHLLDTAGRVWRRDDSAWVQEGPTGVALLGLGGDQDVGLIATEQDNGGRFWEWRRLPGGSWTRDTAYGMFDGMKEMVRFEGRWLGLDPSSGDLATSTDLLAWAGGSNLPGALSVAASGARALVVGEGGAMWTRDAQASTKVARAAPSGVPGIRVVAGRVVVEGARAGMMELVVRDLRGKVLWHAVAQAGIGGAVSFELPRIAGAAVATARGVGFDRSVLLAPAVR